MYDRTFDGKAYDFGVVGVDKGTLIMYDQQSRSRWSQLFGEAVEGPMKGEKLVKLPSTMTTWGKWKKLHPDTTVYVKRSVPYRARFTADYFARQGRVEGPLQARTVVLGVEGHVNAKAWRLSYLRKNRLLNEELEGKPLLVWLSEDGATARVYDRRLDDKTLTFKLLEGDQLQDEQSRSRWNALTGEAVSGPLQGKKLGEIISTFSIWHAWHKYRPDTELVE